MEPLTAFTLLVVALALVSLGVEVAFRWLK